MFTFITYYIEVQPNRDVHTEVKDLMVGNGYLAADNLMIYPNTFLIHSSNGPAAAIDLLRRVCLHVGAKIDVLYSCGV